MSSHSHLSPNVEDKGQENGRRDPHNVISSQVDQSTDFLPPTSSDSSFMYKPIRHQPLRKG